MYKIVKKETLNSVVELMEIHAPFVARKCEPGQFIILRVDEDGERVPLTIADYDRECLPAPWRSGCGSLRRSCGRPQDQSLRPDRASASRRSGSYR